jgi:hypothetical protein
MYGVFQNIVPPRLWCGGGHTRWVERGVNILEDARHCSVLYIRTLCVITFEVGLILWKGNILFNVLDIGHHTDCFKL